MAPQDASAMASAVSAASASASALVAVSLATAVGLAGVVGAAKLVSAVALREGDASGRRPRAAPGEAAPVGLDPQPCPNAAKRRAADLMVSIAQVRETRKSQASTVAELESFHTPEEHDFFNESYYFNGADLKTGDRIVSRISRRGKGGKRSYMFLLLDLAEHGELAIEDEVPAELTASQPLALGLAYVCVVPMMRWIIKYSGPMRRGCVHPRDKAALAKAEQVQVSLELAFDVDTPLFWYMRDDHPICLARNLTQEPWGANFVRVCLKRSSKHAHYEDFGRLRGSVRVGAAPPTTYDFGTFRDHSWDIRRWATMDSLCILLIALEKPLVVRGHEYWYVDLTLVNMPGNLDGVARYSTGYLLGKRGQGAPNLVLVAGTSALDVGAEVGPPGFPGGAPERYPLPELHCVMFVAPHPRDVTPLEAETWPDVRVDIAMTGPIRRVIYWPDQGDFKVYEDSQDFTLRCLGQTVRGYGTRQTGYRVGEFDPSLGGCG